MSDKPNTPFIMADPLRRDYLAHAVRPSSLAPSLDWLVSSRAIETMGFCRGIGSMMTA